MTILHDEEPPLPAAADVTPGLTVMAAAAIEIGRPMPPEIAAAVLQVMSLAHAVGKAGFNEFHRYRYATAADLLFLVQPAMVEAGLLITQHVANVGMDDGGNQVIEFRFALTHKTGTTWVYPGVWLGVAGDRTKSGLGDKWFSKALTSAEKYFLLKLLKISTIEDAEIRLNDGDPDADAGGQGDRVNGHDHRQPPTTRTAAPPAPANPVAQAARVDANALRADIYAPDFPGAAAWLERHRDRLEVIKEVSTTAYEALLKHAKQRDAAAPAA